MLFATIAQPYLFLWMMLSGMIAAVWYALVGGVRRLMQAGRLLSLFTDFVFALGLAVIISAFFIWGSYGEMRLFGFLGAACGYLVMHFLVLRPVSACSQHICKRLRAVCAKIAQNRLLNIIFK